MQSPETPQAEPNRRLWYLLFTLLVSAVLLYLAFKGVDWEKMVGALRRTRLEYMALAFLLLSTSYFIRGMRWRILLSAERDVPPFTMFWATCVGYLGNNFLPARAGEVIRSVMIGRNANISVSYVFATAITERVLDLVALIITSVVSLMFLRDAPEWLLGTTKILAACVPVVILGICFAHRLQGVVRWLLVALRVPHALAARLTGLMEQFLLGMRAFIHPSRGIGFAAVTAVIWLLDALVTITVAHAMSEVLVLPQALLLLAALGISSAVPSTPGGLGVLQFVGLSILTPFGFTQSDALAYIIAFQAVMYSVVLLWGGIGLWRLGGRRAVVVPVGEGS